MERFDTLPNWGMFSVPQVLRPQSSDHVVEMRVDIPKTCVGPADLFSATVTLSGNPDWLSKVKKVRVERITLALEQIVSYRIENVAEPFTKIKRIAETSVNVGGIKIIDKPYVQKISLAFPVKDQRDKSGFIDKSASILPKSAAFTTKCALYAVDFQATIRATFKGAKDMVAIQQLTASQYNQADSAVIMRNIEAAVYEYADLDLITGLCGPPQICRRSDNNGSISPTGKRRTLIMD